MIQLRCTGKAQKQLGLKLADLCQPKETDSILGNWYLNLATIDRRKIFLFMNETTFLSFVLYGVKKSNTKFLHEIFLKSLNQLLALEGFNNSTINNINHEYLDLEYTKTNSKSVLGNMNDIMDHYKHHIYYDGGLKHCDLGEIIMKANRIPQRNLDWKYSIDKVQELLN